MKVVLDLDALLAAGQISAAEYDRLSLLGAKGTTSLAFNLLVGFGIIAVAGAALALLPAPATGIVVGLAICALGIGLVLGQRGQWQLLARICIAVGALLFAGGVIWLGQGATWTFGAVVLVSAAAGIVARSALLVVVAVLALASMLGAKTGYLHAAYFLGVEEPLLTIGVFSLLGVVAYRLSRRLPAGYAGLTIAAARTAVFLVNFGFWIGSLWGDRIGADVVVPPAIFALSWALALLAAGVWGWRRNLRWLVNVAAVFGAIHFYTQWFERLGASAGTVLVAGLLALAFALALHALNARLESQGAPPHA